jgi:hypothetical protein
MGKKELLDLIPKDGFLKVSDYKPKDLSKEERAALIRKGNEAFNAKKYKLAKRVYITTGYSDGLIRLAEYYMSIKQPLEALKLYWIAPHRKGVDRMIEKAAQILGSWLKAEEGKENDHE